MKSSGGHPCPECGRLTLGTPSPSGGRFLRCDECVSVAQLQFLLQRARNAQVIDRLENHARIYQMPIQLELPFPKDVPGRQTGRSSG